MGTYRTTVQLPQRAGFYSKADYDAAIKSVIEKLSEQGTVAGRNRNLCRWEIETKDEYELAVLVKDTETDIASWY